MKSFLHMRWLLIIFGLVGTIVVVSFFISVNPHSTNNSEIVVNASKYSPQYDRELWTKQVTDRGGEKAYNTFVKANRKSIPGVRHVRAHIMGEVLFSEMGVKGISICSSEFGFGCFHGFFTNGFSTLGREFISEATDMCIKKFGPLGTGCQHGIGHGIVEYVGREKLDAALDLCSGTHQPTALLGCTSGVFMEYNTPFLVLPGIEPEKPIPFSDANPYAECTHIANTYKESCYYELAGWWETVLHGDKRKIGSLCSKVTNQTFRDACAMGIGNIIGATNEYDINKSILLCKKTPTNIQVPCYEGIAWSMFSSPEYSERAEKVCDRLLSIQEMNTCKNSYNLSKRIK